MLAVSPTVAPSIDAGAVAVHQMDNWGGSDAQRTGTRYAARDYTESSFSFDPKTGRARIGDLNLGCWWPPLLMDLSSIWDPETG